LIFKHFTHFITLITLMRKCIEKIKCLPLRVWGWVWGGWGAVFTHMRKCVKKSLKCLIFNDLLFYARLYASFTQLLRKLAFFTKICDNNLQATHKPLIFNALQIPLKRLIFNAFRVLNGAGVFAW
jgi:hypothetical protein